MTEPAQPLSPILQELFALRQFGMKLGLDTMQELARRLGNPQETLRFIHIAGTNGKGSTAVMLESILRTAGFKTGLFTSPHLIWFGERIQVNRIPLNEAEVASLYAEIKPVCESLAKGQRDKYPTFFEVSVAMALLTFKRAQVDWVVWETGMGGRLDATNIVTPALSIICALQQDHSEHLGKTLESIASEKAGIIKPGVPVVSHPQQPGPARVLKSTAQRLGSPLCMASPESLVLDHESMEGQRFRKGDVSYHLKLLGDHQRSNASVVFDAVHFLRKQGVGIPEHAVFTGLAHAEWPARFQILRKEPPVVLDGAHNEGSIRALVQQWKRLFPGKTYRLIFGILRDKEMTTVINLLAPLATRIWVLPIQSSRTAMPEELKIFFRNAKPDADIRLVSNFQEAWNEASCGGQPLLITGSLYLAGEVLAQYPFT